MTRTLNPKMSFGSPRATINKECGEIRKKFASLSSSPRPIDGWCAWRIGGASTILTHIGSLLALGIQAGRLFIVTLALYRCRTCGQSSTPILSDERRGGAWLGAWAHASLQYRESDNTVLARVSIRWSARGAKISWAAMALRRGCSKAFARGACRRGRRTCACIHRTYAQ
jgi:hypothetical protein